MDLNLDELADLLSVPKEKVRSWLDLDSIPFYRIGNDYRFNQEEIENWIFNNRSLLNKERQLVETCIDNSHLKYSLYKAIHKGTVFSEVSVRDLFEVFRIVCDYMAVTFHLDAQVLLEMLMSREEMISTGLGGGIAVPHARDFFLTTHYSVIVVVLLKEPVDCKALDGEPVNTLFFLFARDDRNHLNLLSKISYLVSGSSARSFFKTQPSKEMFLSFIKTWEGQLEHD